MSQRAGMFLDVLCRTARERMIRTDTTAGRHMRPRTHPPRLGDHAAWPGPYSFERTETTSPGMWLRERSCSRTASPCLIAMSANSWAVTCER